MLGLWVIRALLLFIFFGIISCIRVVRIIGCKAVSDGANVFMFIHVVFVHLELIFLLIRIFSSPA